MNGDVEKYVIGDLLWAKIGNYPFWPCMVSYDPFKGCYFEKKKVRSKEVTIYHVQYFGKQVQHGWTAPGLIFPFKGERDYHLARRELLKNATTASVKKKINAKYNVAAGIHESWIIAIREAEDALEVEIDTRFEYFVFNYSQSVDNRLRIKNNASKKSKSKAESNKPQSAVEIYGPDLKVCRMCSKGFTDLNCSGSCLQYFHKECLGIINAPQDFKCINCEQGLFTCFICKKANASLTECSKCSYRYHEECVKKFPCGNIKKKICPYHACLSCYNEKPRNITMSVKGPFVNCIKCPTAFHASLQCFPVGSVKLSSTAMICPDHFLGKNKVSPKAISNVSYCSVCSEGGELICCESCPNSYHIKCINTEEIPAGDYFCDDCVNRQYLYVGMVVWAKTGHFRWWPAHIVDFDKLPVNVQNIEVYDGEFPIQYYGTAEYCWTHRGKVIPYAEHHKDYCRASSRQSKLDVYYRLSLDEALEAFDEYDFQRRLRNLSGQRNAYKHIKVNRAIPPAQIFTSTSRYHLQCSCNPNRPYPCSSPSCLNRSMLMECHPDVCLAGERCENQKFQKRHYAKVTVFRTELCGWGLQTEQFISKGSFVIEYVGHVITHEEYEKRLVEMRKNNVENFYFLYLDSRRMIDAGPQGNFSRFINHSCDPNCEMSKWSVNGDSRIGIFAIKDIHPGQELTFNYQSDSIKFEQKCCCGASNCQRFVGRNVHSGVMLQTGPKQPFNNRGVFLGNL